MPVIASQDRSAGLPLLPVCSVKVFGDAGAMAEVGQLSWFAYFGQELNC